jgi:2-polyprenyl-6-methoxyphenol hydroxylase-like FAD-dependent oxidoreductase
MTPGRGVGANTALLDALLLCRQLQRARALQLEQTRAVASYESAMREYGFEAVRESLKQMSSDGPLHHPIWGGPALAAMKATLRTVNALPPLKRKFARSQNDIRDRQRHPALAGLSEADSSPLAHAA